MNRIIETAMELGKYSIKYIDPFDQVREIMVSETDYKIITNGFIETEKAHGKIERKFNIWQDDMVNRLLKEKE